VLGKIAVSRQVQLRDGRRLGFAEWGDPAGKPIFLFHPLPGSRIFRHPDDSIAAALGVRLITVDRPGFGLSDPFPGRKLLNWPDDVVKLADALHIDRFAVLGVEAGGAYALACAYRIPRRLVTVGLVSGLSPLNRQGARIDMIPLLRNSYIMAFRAPTLLRFMMYFGAREAQSYPEKYLSRTDDPLLTESDRALLLQNAEIRAMSLESIAETFRIGSTPYSDEMILLVRPWGFRLHEIPILVYLWHGEKDVIAPSQMGYYLANELLACEAHFIPEEGHGLIFSRWSEILLTLVSEFERHHE
jgi:pimeloyl-ACP methyl ester carboxylesterase